MTVRLFEIWCEGDPLLEFTACHLGYGRGNTLLEACLDLSSRRASFNRFFNKKNMRYIGCKVFDNEQDARYSWG